MLTFVFRAMGVDEGVDQTKDDDYWADEGDEGVELELDPLAEPHRWRSSAAPSHQAPDRAGVGRWPEHQVDPRFTHTSVTTMPTFS